MGVMPEKIENNGKAGANTEKAERVIRGAQLLDMKNIDDPEHRNDERRSMWLDVKAQLKTLMHDQNPYGMILYHGDTQLDKEDLALFMLINVEKPPVFILIPRSSLSDLKSVLKTPNNFLGTNKNTGNIVIPFQVNDGQPLEFSMELNRRNKSGISTYELHRHTNFNGTGEYWQGNVGEVRYGFLLPQTTNSFDPETVVASVIFVDCHGVMKGCLPGVDPKVDVVVLVNKPINLGKFRIESSLPKQD
jgi:hypothetical protein